MSGPFTSHIKVISLSLSLFLHRWQDNAAVFVVSGIILLSMFAVVMLEKISTIPKPLIAFSSFASNNKAMHQIMAMINILALLVCVLVPLVSVRL